MMVFKVLFVGVGSIARRHIQNLRAIAEQQDINLTIAAFHRQTGFVREDGIDQDYCCFSEVPDDFDAVFITNPTSFHLEALRQFHNKGKHFFIEKPVVSPDQILEAKGFSLREGAIYYVACPLRYNAVIQYIKNNINPSDVISVRSISSSYLPDWRPGQDYRKTYSAHRELGGGVSIDLIHEWDYLTWLFGWPDKVSAYIGKKSALEIDSDDYAIYMAEYPDKIAELHLDYFGRKTIRRIELLTKHDTIVGDLVGNHISFLLSGETVDFNEARDDYQKRELEHFLKMTMGLAESENGFMHGVRVLELTQGDILK